MPLPPMPPDALITAIGVVAAFVIFGIVLFGVDRYSNAGHK